MPRISQTDIVHNQEPAGGAVQQQAFSIFLEIDVRERKKKVGEEQVLLTITVEFRGDIEPAGAVIVAGDPLI